MSSPNYALTRTSAVSFAVGPSPPERARSPLCSPGIITIVMRRLNAAVISSLLWAHVCYFCTRGCYVVYCFSRYLVPFIGGTKGLRAGPTGTRRCCVGTSGTLGASSATTPSTV